MADDTGCRARRRVADGMQKCLIDLVIAEHHGSCRTCERSRDFLSYLYETAIRTGRRSAREALFSL